MLNTIGRLHQKCCDQEIIVDEDALPDFLEGLVTKTSDDFYLIEKTSLKRAQFICASLDGYLFSPKNALEESQLEELMLTTKTTKIFR